VAHQATTSSHQSPGFSGVFLLGDGSMGLCFPMGWGYEWDHGIHKVGLGHL
jgi:hypothetical protein